MAWVAAIPLVAMQVERGARTLTVNAPVHHISDDRFAREPMIVEHPGGALFVAGYGMMRLPTNVETPNLWKSTDRGQTFTRVNVGTTDHGSLGNSDVDLAVATDGTLYFASMTYDNRVNEGVNINIGVSHDVGATWAWTQLSNTRWDDRPWVKVAPDGTAHVIWNDGEGVSHAVSTDRGKTWAERPKIHPQGGSSHLAIGPSGEVAVRITPKSASGSKYHLEADLIAVSVDTGRTWVKHPAPGERLWTSSRERDQLPRWVEPVAWDSAAAVYSLWTEPNGVHLAQSRDFGKTWRQWRVVETKDTTSFYPYLIARGKGELAATWFTATMPGYASLRANVARFEVDDAGAPPNVRTGSFEVDATTGKTLTPAGEYVPAILLRDGRVAVVTPIQNGPARRFGFSYWTVAN